MTEAKAIPDNMAERQIDHPLRVLSLIPTFWPRQGGAQMVLAAIARQLGSRIENTVLTRGYRGLPRRETLDHLTVCRYQSPAPEVWKDYATGKEHVSLLGKGVVGCCDVVCSLPLLGKLAQTADVVHVHFPLPLGLSALALRAFNSKPLVVTVHGNADVYELPRSFLPITRFILKRADVVVSVSKDLAHYLATESGVTRPIEIIPNGIDVTQFSPGTRRDGQIVLLTVSRLVPRKNVPVLIKAVEELREQDKADVVLLIAGMGPEQEKIAAMAGRHPEFLYFLGFVDEEQKKRLLTEADVFVQLSTREGLSIAALEALASGTPCVVSDFPGVREPISPGSTGWYVKDPERVDSVLSTLRTVVAARGKLADMRREARSVAEEKYSLQRMGEEYWRVFSSAVRTRSERI